METREEGITWEEERKKEEIRVNIRIRGKWEN